jgi:hypothetical protein
MAMTRRSFALLAAAAARGADDESFGVYGDHPRLFLTPARLRRLRRDRERRTRRWEQFAALVEGRAQFPEPGFAHALYFQITGDESAARAAVRFAEDTPDLRQAAIVYDWCQPHSGRLRAGLEGARGNALPLDVAGVRSVALAAVATGDSAALERTVREWWRGRIVPAINAGQEAIPRGDLYALFELMHAVRDNTGIDLRESAVQFFERLPFAQLLSYYPEPRTAPEGDYRMPAVKGATPSLRAAELSRAADLALIAYDTNSQEGQYLQGFAMYDRFQLATPFGAPYEFLWANPYQPGLSYDLLPPHFYDALRGCLFLRASWRDDAPWLGWFEGELQVFSDGRLRVAPIGGSPQQFRIGAATVIAASEPGHYVVPDPSETVYIVGLPARRAWSVQPARGKRITAHTDPGGVLRIEFPEAFSGALAVSTSP